MIRNEVRELLALAEDLQADDLPGVVATLFSASGSSYRPLGSMLISGPTEDYLAGAVSGGCLEDYILRRGRSLTAEQPAALLQFVDSPLAKRVDVPVLGCGGSIEVLVERLNPDHIRFLRSLAEAYASDCASFAACTIDTSFAPIRVRRTIQTQDQMSIDPAIDSLFDLAQRSGSSVHGATSPTTKTLVQCIPPLTRLVVLGAGNDAQPLCTLAQTLGWHVSIADRRGRLSTRSRFRDADEVITADWKTALSQIDFTPQTAIVVMTHSISDDEQILPLLADLPSAYVGLLGPEHRRSWLLQKLGPEARESLADRLHGPIGLNLGDRSPGGIAIAIVAEIMADLNGKTPVSLTRFPDEAAIAWR